MFFFLFYHSNLALLLKKMKITSLAF